jgi:hypothetical protein
MATRGGADVYAGYFILDLWEVLGLENIDRDEYWFLTY